MLRISLSDSQRIELQALRRTDLPAVARDRLEMVLLSAAGWSPPRIAGHLGRHPHTVRAALKGFAARGTKAFYPDAPGPDPDHVWAPGGNGVPTTLRSLDGSVTLQGAGVRWVISCFGSGRRAGVGGFSPAGAAYRSVADRNAGSNVSGMPYRSTMAATSGDPR